MKESLVIQFDLTKESKGEIDMEKERKEQDFDKVKEETVERDNESVADSFMDFLFNVMRSGSGILVIGIPLSEEPGTSEEAAVTEHEGKEEAAE